MGVLLRPGMRLAERFRMVTNLALIASLYLGAQLASVWWAAHETGTQVSLAGPGAPAWAVNWAPWVMVGLFVAGTYMLTAFVVSSRIGLERLARALGRVAAGEIAASERKTSASAAASEASAMWAALGHMRTNLSAIVSQVRSSAEVIARGSREISDSYSNLSQRTEEQASTLEETSSGMEHLAQTVQQNAAHCRDASNQAQTALAAAEQGAAAVRRAAGSMAEIEQGSRRMADITAAIEALAFQTNILALNAAVEAARAGSQGRGFAVVASEVRALAQRSGEAAKQIKELISDSVGKISEGGRNAAAAGEGMDRIVSSGGQVTRLIGEVTAASTDQSSSVVQLNKAIAQLESVTQQNAALVEQAAAAADGFQQESARMLDVVGAFKLDRAEAREQAVALVKKAAAHLAKEGPERAFRDFQDPRGGFMYQDFFVFVLDMNCILHAHGLEPETCGSDHSGNVDADGKRFSLELVRVAKERGRGWVDYRRLNRLTGRIEAKSSYVERVGHFLVGCGIYRADDAPDQRALPTNPARARLSA